MPPILSFLEFQGQPDFPWWALVDSVVGLALIVYSFLLHRDTPSATPGDALRSPLAQLDKPLAPVRIFRASLPAVALLAGLGIFLVTLALSIIPALRKAIQFPESLLMFWTLAVIAVAVWLIYLRVYRYLSRGRMTALLSLRILSLIFLSLLLFQPVLAFTSSPNKRDKIAVVIDASGSMDHIDEANEPSRFRQSVIAVQNTLLPRLGDHYELQFYAYDGKHPDPIKAEEFDRIVANGTSSDFSAALGLAASGNPKEIIFFSDGIHNGPVALSTSLRNFAVPVDPVNVGSATIEASSVPDIDVVGVDGPETATLNNDIKLTARIRSTAMGSRTIRVQLLQISPGPQTQLAEQRLVLTRDATPQSVEFKYTASTLGRTVLQVAVPVDPDERNGANNQRNFPLLVTDPKLPVLYVEGRVRPEVGRLMRALSTDPNINAVSLVQVRTGEFTISGVKPGDDLKGLPKTSAQWKRFKVIILGDLDASFLSPQQQRDLQDAVKEGAGLLMIGGQRSFAAGGWGATALADILPVSLAKIEPAQVNTPFVPQLTAAGMNSPILRNISDFFIPPGGATPAKNLPQLLGCVAIAGPKPAAEILMVHPTEKIAGNPAVVLAVQQYGKGRSAAFAADTTSQWNVFLLAQGKDSPYNRFWGQMVRWLASQEDLTKKSGPSVTAMMRKDRFEAGEAVTLRANVTDKEGQTTNYASVWGEVTGPDKKMIRVSMATVKDQQGVYEGTYHPQMSGGYSAKMLAAKDKLDLGADTIGFAVAEAAGEMDTLAANPKTMEEISRLTAGRPPVGLTGVEALADALNANVPTTALVTKSSYGLWNIRLEQPVTFTLGHAAGLLFFLTLALEWFFRRKWQLQ